QMGFLRLEVRRDGGDEVWAVARRGLLKIGAEGKNRAKFPATEARRDRREINSPRRLILFCVSASLWQIFIADRSSGAQQKGVSFREIEINRRRAGGCHRNPGFAVLSECPGRRTRSCR